MNYRNKLNVSNSFPFGIEIELSNMAPHNIDIMCDSSPNLHPVGWHQIEQVLDVEYTFLIYYDHFFTCNHYPNDY